VGKNGRSLIGSSVAPVYPKPLPVAMMVAEAEPDADRWRGIVGGRTVVIGRGRGRVVVGGRRGRGGGGRGAGGGGDSSRGGDEAEENQPKPNHVLLLLSAANVHNPFTLTCGKPSPG